MPLHIFISQSASLITGGLDVWKAAKDVVLVALVPALLYIAYRNKYFESDIFLRLFIVLAGTYTALHAIFTIFFFDFTGFYASVIGSVYNTRFFGYFLLGYLTLKLGTKRHLKILITVSVIVAFFVALFGVLQYFMPHDLLESFGYSVDRGVKPLFFIDDKPDLPRVMSTLRDPNKLGAYLIMPMLFTMSALIRGKWNEELFIHPLRKRVLGIFLLTYTTCLFLTFSRGALLSLVVALLVFFALSHGKVALRFIKKTWWIGALLTTLILAGVAVTHDSYLFKNYVFHADEATTKADPNEKRLILYENALERIAERPQGYGPGSSGLVSVKSDSGQILTENYFLQIAHGVGLAGLALFIMLLAFITRALLKSSYKENIVVAVILSSFAGYLFYSLLVHLWTNEAVALQWWLLAGACLAAPRTDTCFAGNDVSIFTKKVILAAIALIVLLSCVFAIGASKHKKSESEIMPEKTSQQNNNDVLFDAEKEEKEEDIQNKNSQQNKELENKKVNKLDLSSYGVAKATAVEDLYGGGSWFRYSYSVRPGTKFIAGNQAITIHNIEYRDITNADRPNDGMEFPKGHGLNGTDKWLSIDFEAVFTEDTDSDHNNETGAIINDIALLRDDRLARRTRTPDYGTERTFPSGDPVPGNIPIRSYLLYPIKPVESSESQSWGDQLFLNWHVQGFVVRMKLPLIDNIKGYIPSSSVETEEPEPEN